MSKILEALRSAVEHRERISLDDIDVADLLAQIEKLLEAERERCAKLCEEAGAAMAWPVAKFIREPKYKGAGPWEDVPDATQWLEDLRGNEAAPGDPK